MMFIEILVNVLIFATPIFVLFFSCKLANQSKLWPQYGISITTIYGLILLSAKLARARATNDMLKLENNTNSLPQAAQALQNYSHDTGMNMAPLFGLFYAVIYSTFCFSFFVLTRFLYRKYKKTRESANV